MNVSTKDFASGSVIVKSNKKVFLFAFQFTNVAKI